MKTRIALLSLGLVSLGFSLDEYMPIAPGKTEIDVGVSYTAGTGRYDNNSKKQGLPSAAGDPAITGIPLQVKYGIIPNLDVELGWTFTSNNNDETPPDGASGFGQPDIAVKYAMPDMGLGFFVDVAIPVATGDFAPGLDLFGNDPSMLAMGIMPGVVYGKNFGKIQAMGLASYQINLENGDGWKPSNVLTVFLKPGYMVTDALAGYLGLKYNMYGEKEITGTAVHATDGNLITILPGVTFTQNGMLAYELNIPITLAGKNQGAYWGVWASVYVTLGK